MTSADAVVVGAGPNGLVAAIVLADAGWDVVVVEAQPVPGGAVRTAELTLPGFHHDVFSAFYPLAAASPAIKRLSLEDHGLVWRRAPVALAHPTPDGNCAVIAPDLDVTARSLDAYRPGDGDGWRSLMAVYDRYGRDLLDALLGPFPPLRAGAALAAKGRAGGLLDLAWLAVVPARRLGEEHFRGEGGRLLLAGNALHTDLAPETAGSGLFGWLLCALAQDVGFPVPEGGAGALAAALVRRLHAAGGQLRCGEPVTAVRVVNGRAVGVRTAGGAQIAARRAVLADVAAPHLYGSLLDEAELPDAVTAGLRRFQWDAGTVKVDWALSGPIPWSAPDARRAGTVHVADSVDDLTRWSADLSTGTVPGRPFLLVGQQSMTDPTRMPPGTETAWAYTHVPRTIGRDERGQVTGRWDRGDEAAMAERMEARVEELAPGFRQRILARHILTPATLPGLDANLDGGAINGGTAQLHQQLVFRPTRGSGRPTTFVDGLYLASSSAHPGGGVHGACGSNAARAAIAHHRTRMLRPSRR
ncbi:NAD(P)/FAD-dependent oxidoreductase [Acidiferrimicrobium sp. IK]|uniref:phytoene desaturase family protein n=1 Tax=Acidiferrimicrobium sp. IK TaxID=2871700 RepID=UPI0021CB11D6|nr:NAD(P)/FAD-dependent oxidoreductase [Acidiferrimicrobium sp. IK]MCU4183085.1 NAD(P)/FAD-dependent oxidoreductase [Acidiferrimicrobium sp. IK]